MQRGKCPDVSNVPHVRDELLEKYNGKLTQTMSGPEYEMVSRVMKAMVGRKITVHGNFES